ncbi:DUF2235 domain-containing protein [Cupriavidus sp.]|uniref:T6SS phospholipase effector Tle1-like catalytic domain-containing protein n=1 Tax=Cupriavidus sp. TaxID=1873897 RepID=UPI0028BE12DF|nr:DUF2235 domain-containing protein [Cupriavidus sp.]
MQDWIQDCHDTFFRALKTATILYPDDFVTCSTCEQRPWVSFFFDGTGNNMDIDRPLNKLSNIARLYEGHSEETPKVSRLYYPGVGTPLAPSNASWLEMVRDSEALGGGAGLGADIRLATAQADLVDLLKYTHRVTRIDIAVFGFSRGAALARAFVNRLIQKCEMRDGILHWPCETALDGESAPLHIRFLGLFDTVESVGLPGKNLHPDMWMSIPEQVERCVHHYATHELRSFFPLTPVDAGLKHCEEIAMPGVHSDVGGGYRPDEQGRSDMLARIPLNRMRLEAAIAGVPFTPPLLLTPDVHALFEYSADLKALYDEYMAAIPTHESREAQILAHVRLYYGWLKSRYKTSPCDVYSRCQASNIGGDAEMDRIRKSYAYLERDAAQLADRAWVADMQRRYPDTYRWHLAMRYEHEHRAPPVLTERESAYFEAWSNPPDLSPNLIRFFDEYVHDSRAGFMMVGNGGYLSPRDIVAMSVVPAATPALAAL